MNVTGIVLGVLFLAVGVLGIVFRSQLDATNMKRTPRWMKPPDGGGEFSPDQRSFRIKGQTVAMSVLILVGLGFIVTALTQ